MAILEAEVEGSESRDHEKPGLAAKGHKQYLWQHAFKKTSAATKSRTITANKKQTVTGEQVEGIMDMIDDEPPCPGVEGGKRQRNSGNEKLAEERRQKALKDKDDERTKKLESMTPAEKKAFIEQEKIDQYQKRGKQAEAKIAQAISRSNKLEGKLMSTKKSAFINPDKMMAKLKAHKNTLRLFTA